MFEGISIDVFDISAAEKKFDELAKNANTGISFAKSAIAEKMGISEDQLNLPGGDFTPGVSIIKDIADNDFREKVSAAMTELRAEQLTGGNGGSGSLTPEQKSQIDIELGKIDKDDFINNEKANWLYNALHIKKRDGSSTFDKTKRQINIGIEGNKENKNLSQNGSVKPTPEERDEVTCIAKTIKNSGIYINEKTKEDPDTMTLCYNGKQSVLRMGKGGFHISTDQSMDMAIGGCENLVINGQSAKHVNGGYNLIIDGPINIYARDSINITSDADMNFTAKGNINFQCNGNFNVCAKGNISTVSKGETALNAKGKLSLLTNSELHIKSDSQVLFGGQGSIGMKGGGNVNIQGSTVNINSGGVPDPSPTVLPDFNIPAAAPTDPVVVKV
jgi:hypothetical protein